MNEKGTIEKIIVAKNIMFSLGGSRTRLLSAPSFEDQTELLNRRLGFLRKNERRSFAVLWPDAFLLLLPCRSDVQPRRESNPPTLGTLFRGPDRAPQPEARLFCIPFTGVNPFLFVL